MAPHTPQIHKFTTIHFDFTSHFHFTLFSHYFDLTTPMLPDNFKYMFMPRRERKTKRRMKGTLG